MVIDDDIMAVFEKLKGHIVRDECRKQEQIIEYRGHSEYVGKTLMLINREKRKQFSLIRRIRMLELALSKVKQQPDDSQDESSEISITQRGELGMRREKFKERNSPFPSSARICDDFLLNLEHRNRLVQTYLDSMSNFIELRNTDRMIGEIAEFVNLL
ncbi:hypothetical protein SNEBB_011276 [Seison nebaliae]|nr:hypothetical protein SNEBB_011276 [Seison nebaliae]